jgi:epoxyqueuosine reductase
MKAHFIDIEEVQTQARSLGFTSLGFAEVSTPLMAEHAQGLGAWLEAGFHGEMGYMSTRFAQRAQPELLLPEVRTVLMVSLDYRPRDPQWQAQAWARLDRAEQAYVSCYAVGRDYHKIVRSRLQKLADKLCEKYGHFSYRAFCDSAPVMELPLAAQAGLGWRGKHTLLLNRDHGSMFFVGCLYTSLQLKPQPAPDHVTEGASRMDEVVPDAELEAHCGTCTKCIDVCPTRAIVAPHRLDARRCISYLTIEHAGGIPLEFREAIGNRIYGCDDCQLICPWNKFAQSPVHAEVSKDLAPRHALEQEFLSNTEGSAIRRIGYWRWRRNLVIAMGNALRGNAADDSKREIKNALQQAFLSLSASPDSVMQEHLVWALQDRPLVIEPLKINPEKIEPGQIEPEQIGTSQK